MRLKLRGSTILLILYGLAILFNMRFFYLGIGISSNFIIIISLLGFLFCVFFCNSALNKMQHRMRYIYIFGFVAILCYLIIFLFTWISFPDQGFRGTVSQSGFFVAVLLIYPLGSYLVTTDNPKKIFKIMNLTAFIWYLLVLAQKILYETSGRVLLSGLLVDDEFNLRSGNLRISLLAFGNLMMVYNFYRLYTQFKYLNKREKLFSIFCLVLGLYEMLFIQQTRMYTLIVLVCFFAIVFFDRNTKSGFFKKVVLIVLAIIFVYQTGILGTFIESFSVSGDYGGSTTARIYAFQYYWDYFLEHPVFGMGFVSDGYYYSLVHGTLGIAYHSDVGLVGQISRWGIFIIPVYIIPLIRWSYITFKIWKNKFEDYSLYIALWVYIIGTSVTLIMMVDRLFVLYPTLMILFEYEYYKLRSATNSNIQKHNYSLDDLKNMI